ncbi:MAG: site-specific DNA-methyltransferase [Fimbriimonadales bacterium]|nr:site-specific DNA-methyltransferase [Fimbriimonadales bacterium]
MRLPTQLNDLDLTAWDTYEDLITDSLWLVGRRDNGSVHSAEYWGNFVPQIPYQAMRRFTKRGDLVIDPFVGLGTTLIEAVRLGRWAIGVDLQPSCVEQTRQRTRLTENPHRVQVEVFVGDSTHEEARLLVQQQMRAWGFEQAQLLILHPPYHDIIKFSNLPEDLSNAADTDAFLAAFERVVRNFAPLLEERRFLVLVVGDKYAKGEWIPLGFYCMERVLRNGFRLKSLCVKDIQENRGKRGQYSLWRYRALKHNFYVFKHEYVMFFEKLAQE